MSALCIVREGTGISECFVCVLGERRQELVSALCIVREGTGISECFVYCERGDRN